MVLVHIWLFKCASYYFFYIFMFHNPDVCKYICSSEMWNIPVFMFVQDGYFVNFLLYFIINCTILCTLINILIFHAFLVVVLHSKAQTVCNYWMSLWIMKTRSGPNVGLNIKFSTFNFLTCCFLFIQFLLTHSLTNQLANIKICMF